MKRLFFERVWFVEPLRCRLLCHFNVKHVDEIRACPLCSAMSRLFVASCVFVPCALVAPPFWLTGCCVAAAYGSSRVD